jgi:hypothetical protein
MNAERDGLPRGGREDARTGQRRLLPRGSRPTCARVRCHIHAARQGLSRRVSSLRHAAVEDQLVWAIGKVRAAATRPVSEQALAAVELAAGRSLPSANRGFGFRTAATCTPRAQAYRTPVPRTAREVDRAMADHPGWRRVGKTLDRDLSMRDFDEALRLVERVAQMAVDNLRRPGTRISEFNGVPLNRQPASWRADRGRTAPGGQDQRGDRRARGVRQLGAMAAAGALDFAGSWIAALIRTRAG